MTLKCMNYIIARFKHESVNLFILLPAIAANLSFVYTIEFTSTTTICANGVVKLRIIIILLTLVIWTIR